MNWAMELGTVGQDGRRRGLEGGQAVGAQVGVGAPESNFGLQTCWALGLRLTLAGWGWGPAVRARSP